MPCTAFGFSINTYPHLLNVNVNKLLMNTIYGGWKGVKEIGLGGGGYNVKLMKI